MTIIVPHHSTQEVVVPKVDQAAGQLLAVGGVKNIQIVDQKK